MIGLENPLSQQKNYIGYRGVLKVKPKTVKRSAGRDPKTVRVENERGSTELKLVIPQDGATKLKCPIRKTRV